MNGNVRLLGMVAITTMMFASCSNDELKEVYKGEEISFTTQVKTRATETTLKNLEGFYVYAKADNYADMFINGQEAKKDKESNNGFTITDKDGVGYLWPTGVDRINFWAYGPNNLNKDIFKAQIDNTKQNFTVALASSMENGGTDQQDFIVAHKEVRKSDVSGGNIPLGFYHALSQICINAKCPDHANYNVYIKGAWLVNVHGNGTLAFKASDKPEDESTAIDHMSWTSSVPTSYGAKLNNEDPLSGQNTSLIGFDMGDNKNNNLMLIPQNSQKKWDSKSNPKGAYIMLLCRIESIHNGAIHSGSSDSSTDGPVYEDKDKNKHYHQIFPVSTQWKKTQYAYTCVGIDADWKPNHKYIYNLVFCGQGSGAGLYPPKDLPENLPDIDGVEVVPTPDDKVGESVLDKPLSFTVSVGDWANGTTGNDDGNTNMD